MKGVGERGGRRRGAGRGCSCSATKCNIPPHPPPASLQIVALGHAAVPEQPLVEDGTVALGELEGMLESMERRTFVDPVKVWRGVGNEGAMRAARWPWASLWACLSLWSDAHLLTP